ncbi:MAG: xylulokinase [Planctomycetota bacterium]|nr:xylulokinase [Planctomycetota bacterium]
MSILLGIDVGTSSTKALAVSPTGDILAESTASYPLHHPRPLWSEQSPEDWWQATVSVVRDVVKKVGGKRNSVTAIGLSGQMHGSVFLDKKYQVIRPALLWNDQRTAAECQEIENRVGGRKALIRMVANPALTGFTAPKIVWLRNHEPRNYDKVCHILLPKDYIRWRLTGELATDVSDASGTLLLDVANRDWNLKVLSKLEIDSRWLPACFESEDVTGQIAATVAESLGLSTECIVVGGAGDCAANAVGNGVVKSGLVASSLGTSGVVFAHSDEVQIDPQGRLHTFCHAVRDKWHLMGVTLSAAGSLEWFCQQIVKTGDPKASMDSLYDRVTSEASAVARGSQGLFFLPYLAGERTPHADPLARGSFVGLTLSHTRGHLVRSIMEGVAYSLRDCIQLMQELDVPIRQIRAGGGGARSPLWRQIQANVFGQKVVTLNAEQGPAYGVALLAAVGAGNYKNIQEACKATIHINSETPVQREPRQYYDRAFPVYRHLYQTLKDDFAAIANLEC